MLLKRLNKKTASGASSPSLCLIKRFSIPSVLILLPSFGVVNISMAFISALYGYNLWYKELRKKNIKAIM